MSIEIRATGCNHWREPADSAWKFWQGHLSSPEQMHKVMPRQAPKGDKSSRQEIFLLGSDWRSLTEQLFAGEAAASIICSKPIFACVLPCKDAGWGCVNYWKMKADGGGDLDRVMQEMFQNALPGLDSQCSQWLLAGHSEQSGGELASLTAIFAKC